MSSSVTAPTAAPAPAQGHCSQCGKVWTLNERQGVCQWCGKRSICQPTEHSRPVKPARQRKQRQAPTIGNGYDQLEGEYLTYYNVASRFAGKAIPQDREDLLQNIILSLAEANHHKPLSEPAMYRIASRRVADYWREHYKLTSGLDCGHCSNKQRKRCKENWLYGQCPRAVKVERLSKPIIDSEGNLTELGELIADDTALDIPQWLELNEQLLHTPDRALAIAGKIQDGEKLTPAESRYLYKLRRKLQKNLL